MRRALLLLLALLAAVTVAAQPQITGVGVEQTSIGAVNELTITYDLESEDRLWYVDTQVLLPPVLDERERAFTGYTYSFNETYRVPSSVDVTQLELIITPVQRDPQSTGYSVRIRPIPSTGAAPQIVTTGEVDLLVEPIRNIEQGTTVLFPVVIANGQDHDTIVDLHIDGVLPWATYGVRPQQRILAPAQRTTIAYLALAVDREAALGMHDITITATHDETTQEVRTAVAVLDDEREEPGMAWWIPWLIALAIIIAVVLVAIAWNNKEEEDEDLITYY